MLQHKTGCIGITKANNPLKLIWCSTMVRNKTEVSQASESERRERSREGQIRENIAAILSYSQDNNPATFFVSTQSASDLLQSWVAPNKSYHTPKCISHHLSRPAMCCRHCFACTLSSICNHVVPSQASTCIPRALLHASEYKLTFQ